MSQLVISGVMKNRVAVVVYPEFSLQELATTSAVFRWYGESPSTVVAADMGTVISEEGISVQPEIALEDFDAGDFDCLVLPGCSDLRESLRDDRLIGFLRGLSGNDDLVIGAIGSAPVYLARAGLLAGRRFTNSLFVEMNDQFSFIDESQLAYEPVVVDGKIVTAVGEAYQQFAVTLARAVGHECPEQAYRGDSSSMTPGQLKHHLPPEGMAMFQEEFADLFD